MTKTKNDDFDRGYKEGYLDGFHAARDNESLMSPNIPTQFDLKTLSPFVCPRCGIKQENMTGYLCPDNMCPVQFKSIC